jgi:hypothetical protein
MTDRVKRVATIQALREAQAAEQAANETRFVRAAINYLSRIPFELRDAEVEPLHYVEEVRVVIVPKRDSRGGIAGVGGRIQLCFNRPGFFEGGRGHWLANAWRERELDGASYSLIFDDEPIYGGDDPFVLGGDR